MDRLITRCRNEVRQLTEMADLEDALRLVLPPVGLGARDDVGN